MRQLGALLAEELLHNLSNDVFVDAVEIEKVNAADGNIIFAK